MMESRTAVCHIAILCSKKEQRLPKIEVGNSKWVQKGFTFIEKKVHLYSKFFFERKKLHQAACVFTKGSNAAPSDF